MALPQRGLPLQGGDVYSWGSGEMGQLGFPLLEDLLKDQDGYPYQPTASLVKAFEKTRICQISGGDGHTTAVTVHGTLYSWGASACGQLGHSDTDNMPKDVEGYPYQPVPLLIESLQDVCIVQIACGDAHTVALSREGLLYSWGGGGCGQLGHSETSRMPKDEDGCPYQPAPRIVERLRPHVATTVACGKAHTIAVSEQGWMFTWGAGACGQLGHPDTASFPSDEDGYPFQPIPREVEHLKDHKVISTACGDVHTLALTSEGCVFSFGGGSYGQLGVKDVGAMPVDADNCPYMPTPQRIVGLEKITKLSCGDSHSLTVDHEGRVFCWGANSCGQLGLTNPDDSRLRKDPDGIPHLPTPAHLEALADQVVVDIACGEAHSLAVTASGSLYSWGACSCGQLGLGSCDGMPVDSDGYPYQPTPALVTQGFHGKAVLRVACGGVHNLAVTEPDASLGHSLATLVNSDVLSDVCFRLGGGNTFYAHMCILKHSALALHQYVQQQMQDRGAPQGQLGTVDPTASLSLPDAPVIEMSDVRPDVFADFMHFVYTSDVDACICASTNFDSVLELYHMSSKFQLQALLPRCRRVIRQQLGKRSLQHPWLPFVGGAGSNVVGAASAAHAHALGGASGGALGSASGSAAPRRSAASGMGARACPGCTLGSDDVVGPSRPPLPGGLTGLDLVDASGGGDDGGGGGNSPPERSPGGLGIFFLPTGQALVLDGESYRAALRKGTLLDLADAEAPDEESKTVLEDSMRALLADPKSSDVQLIVRRESGQELEFGAHKAVLSCRSAYFRALFSGQFRERSQCAVFLQDVQPDQLHLLLNFMYTDDWPFEEPDFALDMLPIADRFSVLQLKRLCERTLIMHMSVANAPRVFALGDRYSCTRLRGRALIFMTDPRNFHLVMKTEGFAELDKVLILEILHSHKSAPAPCGPPSEPLPGNSATLGKGGQTQSKSRDHRHLRGGGTTSSSSASRSHGGQGGQQGGGGAGAAGNAGNSAATSSSLETGGGTTRGGGSSTSSQSFGNGGSSGSGASPGNFGARPGGIAASILDENNGLLSGSGSLRGCAGITGIGPATSSSSSAGDGGGSSGGLGLTLGGGGVGDGGLGLSLSSSDRQHGGSALSSSGHSSVPSSVMEFPLAGSPLSLEAPGPSCGPGGGGIGIAIGVRGSCGSSGQGSIGLGAAPLEVDERLATSSGSSRSRSPSPELLPRHLRDSDGQGG